MKGFVFVVLVTVSFLLRFVSPVQGQAVLVQITAAESGEPIAGAFVSLLHEDGRVSRSALTNSSGRFLIPVPDPGVYQVKAEMIGREANLSPAFSIRGGESRQINVALSFHAIPLAGIHVEADERCRLRPDEASEIARVWDEARTALAVQSWTEREGLYRLEISTYDRDLDATGRTVEKENRKETTELTRTPFVSLPVEDLMARGFIQPQEGGGHQYFGPDAPVLLSDPFLDTHCLRLTRSEDLPGSIGLAFEPVRRGGLPDVEGTLWLDQETANLQFLEYGYTSAPYREAQGVAGGRIEFEAMPNGAWIIDRWWIRAPIVVRQPSLARGTDSGIRVAAIRETGGEVTGATTLDQEKILETKRGSLSGLVWDSTTSSPLAGATVFLSGTQYASVTDSEGRFLVDGILGGTFTASFTHSRLDSLGILATNAEVEINPGEVSELRFSLPSSETLLLAACRADEREDGAAVLSGVVRDQISGEPVPGAMVRVDWQEIHRINPVARVTDEWIEVRANGDGFYTACGIPLDELFEIQASFLGQTSDRVEDIFQSEEHRLLDLRIVLPEGILTDGRGAAFSVKEAGAQGVQGVLIEPESGTPVRGAEVTIRDGSGRISVTAVTNQKGFFRLQTPVPGRYILSAQALGYAEVEDEAVEVTLGHLAVLEVQMPPEALALEPLVVTADRRAFHLEMEGFYERKELGGIFITPEVLEKRRPRKLSDVLFGLAGVRVGEQSLGAGPRLVWFRVGERPKGGICWPMVFVDRHIVSNGGLFGGADSGAVDDFVHGLDVLAVEVYSGPSNLPSEFNGPNAGCGVIVIWTKKGGGG